MDWEATRISLALAAATCAVLLPFGIWLGRRLATTDSRSKPFIEAALMLPLVLPPTVTTPAPNAGVALPDARPQPVRFGVAPDLR